MYSNPTPTRCALSLLALSACALFTPELTHAAVSFGDIGQNVASNATGMAKGITMIGYLAGVIFVILGIVEMYQASKNEPQKTFGGGIVKILVGVLALALGEIVGSGAATLFGSDQTSGLGELGIN